MKYCPRCSQNYSDDTLEFCLEDGNRLVSLQTKETEIPTVTLTNKDNSQTQQTVSFPYSDPADHQLKSVETTQISAPSEIGLLKDKIVQKSHKVLEIAPIIIALTHNWWQWIYLSSHNYSSFSNYILSANFLMWMALLFTGVTLSLLSVKRSSNRGFAYTSLVILSINLILFLVPKR